MTDVASLIKTFKKTAAGATAEVGLKQTPTNRLPTGVFQFDLATGGGFPEGRICVLYGTESSMKTTLCLKLIAQTQKIYPDKKAVFIDVEGRLNRDWAVQLGVDTDQLVYIVPQNAEQVVDMIEGLLQADDLSVIVLDSLAALITQRELDTTADQAVVGVNGILINKLYRKVSNGLNTAIMNGRTPTLILINQIRFKIGVLHGDPETMPGGPAFKFASSLTVRLYGKDVMEKSIHTKLPAWKEVSMIIKKYSVPIVARSAEYMIATVKNPDLNLDLGQSYDWNTVLQYLKSIPLLSKHEKSGWIYTDPMTGECTIFATQDDLKTKYFADETFAREMKQGIIRHVLDKGDKVDVE